MDPAHIEIQRTIATGLFERFRSETLVVDGVSTAQETFVNVVAPWITYEGAPSPDEIQETRVNMVIGLHEAFVALRGILPAIDDKNWRLRDAIEATNRLGVLLESDMPPLSAENL